MVLQPPRAGAGSGEEVKTAAAPEPYFDPYGRFIHKCSCGRDASFGFGVWLREGKLGTWYCAECKPLN
jgi:hypothetical protein